MFTQPVTEMSTESRRIMLHGSIVQPVPRADNHATICEPVA
jgi:hypothetical protein